MANELQQTLSVLTGNLTGKNHNRYSLTVFDLPSPLSVLSVQGSEQLNQPWRYEITFTSSDHHIPINAVLSQSASFRFLAPNLVENLTKISSLDKPATERKLHGVITEFSQLAVSKDEARYRVVLQPRLALFASDHNSAIYQNQSVLSCGDVTLQNTFRSRLYALQYFSIPLRQSD